MYESLDCYPDPKLTLETIPAPGKVTQPALPATDQKSTMKAVVYQRYGSPDVLELKEVDKPVVQDDEVLVRVKAASVNPADWHYMTGLPYIARMSMGLRRPKDPKTGVDMAGVVEAIGKNVTEFQQGDEVFCGRSGAFAEYACVPEDKLVRKPANITLEQAAAIPIAAITALQALRDWGQIRPGQKVLINGASGGVGTFAVQIAKSFGVEVTGVCSTRNLDLVRSLGADHVVDYTKEDFTKNGQRYDLILDNAGNRSLSDYRRALVPKGILVIVGATKGSYSKEGRWIGPLALPIKSLFLRPFVSQKMVFRIAKLNKPDLLVLKELIERGKVTPVIDSRYPLSKVPDAVRYFEEGHARGKIVITV